MVIEELELPIDSKIKLVTPNNAEVQYWGFYSSYRLRESGYMTINGYKQLIPTSWFRANLQDTYIAHKKVFVDPQSGVYSIIDEHKAPAKGLLDISKTYFALAELPRLLYWNDKAKSADMVTIDFNNISHRGHIIEESDFIERELFNANQLKAELTPNDDIALKKGAKAYGDFLMSKQLLFKRETTFKLTGKTQHEFNEEAATVVYNFDKDVWGNDIELEDYLSAIRYADFSHIYPNTKKAKAKYLIYILKEFIFTQANNWYNTSAKSINTTKEKCSGANTPEDWRIDVKSLVDCIKKGKYKL